MIREIHWNHNDLLGFDVYLVADDDEWELLTEDESFDDYPTDAKTRRPARGRGLR